MNRYLDIIWSSGLDGLVLCLEVLAVMAPILLLYELAKAYGLFDRPWSWLSSIMSRLGMGPKAILPLMVGLFLGLVYGAGILVAMSRQNDLSRAERLALAVFLVTCHSLIDDTIVFTLVGGSAIGIVLPRIILAFSLTAILAHWARSRKQRGLQGAD